MSKKKKAEKKTGKKTVMIIKGDLSRKSAEALQSAIFADFDSADKNLIAGARKLHAFILGNGWRALGYESMTAWRIQEVDARKFYGLKNVMKLLEAGVPPERVERMKLTNIDTLVRSLPPKDWKDEKILTLAEGPVQIFSEVAEKKSAEEGMHVESLERRGFSLPKSLIDNWDLALKVAELVDGCQSLDRRVEAIIGIYLNSQSREEGLSRLQLYQSIAS